MAAVFRPAAAREDPVHYCPASFYGHDRAMTKYKDIMQVEINDQVYSSASELGGIAIEDQPKTSSEWIRRSTVSSAGHRGA